MLSRHHQQFDPPPVDLFTPVWSMLNVLQSVSPACLPVAVAVMVKVVGPATDVSA